MSAEASRTRTAEDNYDHAIKLFDSTVVEGDETPSSASNGSWRRLARNPTRSSVKEQLSRRKYRSWRQNKFETDGDAAADLEPIEEPTKSSQAVAEAHPDNGESQTVDFGARPATSETNEQPKLKEPMSTKKPQQKPDTEVDILYENQRGSFFCGIPLYSHSSLLNFDPAAWVTRDFRDSPVNITNAQVPDPSWMWAWKTWYVDMSDDVDEEGWQYSFTFGKNFAWHGNHPWFHSFVRRRRWLRKRIRRVSVRQVKEGSLDAAHHLNADYFTIHSRQRDRSPAEPSNPEAQLARPASFTSLHSIGEEVAKPEDVKDIPSLLKAVRSAINDREKVDFIKHFVCSGGDEIFYLQDSMDEIMSQFVFQTSKKQILQYLKDQAEEAQHHRDDHDAEERPEGPIEKRRIDNLLAAAEAANKEIQGLEYWSDRKHVLQTEDEDQVDDYTKQKADQGIGEIRGISEKAQTSLNIKVDRRLINKGKKPERPEPYEGGTGGQYEEDPHLGKDDLYVADEQDKKSISDENAWKGQSAQPIQL